MLELTCATECYALDLYYLALFQGNFIGTDKLTGNAAQIVGAYGQGLIDGAFTINCATTTNAVTLAATGPSHCLIDDNLDLVNTDFKLTLEFIADTNDVDSVFALPAVAQKDDPLTPQSDCFSQTGISSMEAVITNISDVSVSSSANTNNKDQPFEVYINNQEVKKIEVTFQPKSGPLADTMKLSGVFMTDSTTLCSDCTELNCLKVWGYEAEYATQLLEMNFGS